MPLLTGDDNDNGIVTPSPTGFAPQPVTQVQIVSSEYKDVAVDTKWTPINSLMTMVEGSYWTVDYYSQVIDTDTPLSAQAVTVSAPYQQYNRIQSLQIKVTTPLKTQQDDQTKAMDIDGSAVIFAGLIPNEGDAFIADIGVGKYAVFRITATEKLAIYKQAAYKIDYAFASTDQEYLDDLTNKTVKDLVYRQDFLVYGQNPVIETQTSASIDSLQETIDRLTTQYFAMFYDPEYKTVMMPEQSVSVYDPFLNDFLVRYFSPTDSPYIQQIKQLNVQDDPAMKQDNFWTAIFNCDATYLKTGFTKVGLVYCSQFSDNPFNNGIKWSGIDCCVYPMDPKIGLYGLRSTQVKTLVGTPLASPTAYNYMWPDSGDEYVVTEDPTPSDPQPTTPPAQPTDTPTNAVTNMYPPSNTAILNDGAPVGQPVPITPAINSDGSYVLSANFYNRTNTQSVLESAVWQYMTGQTLDPVQLSNTAALYYTWGVLEQYYYIPLLIVLMNSYIRTYQGD